MKTLQVEKRDAKESIKELREAGIIPAVFYGPKQEAVSIKLRESDFIKLYREVGESTIIILKTDDEEHESLIHEVTLHPVKTEVQHVDFYVIERGKKLQLNIPIEFTGEAPVEKEDGVIVKVMHEIEIEARPRDLPQHIEVSLESLVDFDSQITAQDLTLPEGVELITEPEEMIVVVQHQKEEEEDEPAEIDMDAIEVAGEKKDGGDGEDEGASEGGEDKE